MDYETFKMEFAKAVERALHAEFSGRFKVTEQMKADGMKEAMVFKPDGEHTGVVVYFDKYYEEMQEHQDMDILVDYAVETFKSGIKEIGNIGLEIERPEDLIKAENIRPTLVGREGKEEYLETVAHVPMGDLAITFTVPVADIGIITITQNHLEYMGVTAEELKEIAIQNPLFTNEVELTSMHEMLCGLQEGKDEVSHDISHIMDEGNESMIPMVVISNRNKTHGASSILHDETMQKVADVFGGDVYVLPSSIHECILVPESCGPTKAELQQMVSEINETQLLPEEVLSNQVYLYDAMERTIQQVTGTKFLDQTHNITEPQMGRGH